MIDLNKTTQKNPDFKFYDMNVEDRETSSFRIFQERIQ